MFGTLRQRKTRFPVPQEAPRGAFYLWRRVNAWRMAVATDSSGGWWEPAEHLVHFSGMYLENKACARPTFRPSEG